MTDDLVVQSVREIDLCFNKLFDMGLTPMNINGMILGRLVVLNRTFEMEQKLKDVLAAIVDGQVDDAQEFKVSIQ